MSKQSETITFIPIEKLIPFRDHPFQIRDDEQMKMITESIRSVGVLVPAIARPLPDGAYELISGHRRKRASEILGLSTLPVIVRDVDHDTGTVMMVDSNFQREEILPSERARAYKMKLEAIKRQGARTDLTSAQVGQKLERKSSRDLIAENSPDSSSQIQRYLRLNELIPELLQMVDERKIALTPAAEISYLTKEEQEILFMTIDCEMATPSLSQAQRIRKMSESGEATREKVTDIMLEEKTPLRDSITLSHDTLKKYFPKSYSIQKIEQIIFKLLDNYLKRQREKEHSL